MVVSCSAYGCSERFRSDGNTKFYLFPKNEKRRQKWIHAVRRANWKPAPWSRICSKHFQTGIPSLNENHPDHVPNQFVFNCPSNSETILKKKMATSPRIIETNNEVTSDSEIRVKHDPKKFFLKKNSTHSKCLPVSSVSVVPSKKQLQQKKKSEERCNMKKKYAKNSLFPSIIKVSIEPTQPNNSLSFEGSNGDASLEQEKTETTAAGDLGEKSPQPLPNFVSVHKATLTFAEILDVLYRQRRISEPAKNKLKTALPKGEDSAHVVEPTAEGQKRQYSTELRNFALSFYFYSYKAYIYAWRNYNTFLPPPSALCKGYEISGVTSGDLCESVAPSIINQLEQTIE